MQPRLCMDLIQMGVRGESLFDSPRRLCAAFGGRKRLPSFSIQLERDSVYKVTVENPIMHLLFRRSAPAS